MSETDELRRELGELKDQMRMVTEALISVSEANGCALDALLALMPALGPHGLLAANDQGVSTFMEALKAQHSQLHQLNTRIMAMVEATGIDPSAVVLTPAPDPFKAK